MHLFKSQRAGALCPRTRVRGRGYSRVYDVRPSDQAKESAPEVRFVVPLRVVFPSVGEGASGP